MVECRAVEIVGVVGWCTRTGTRGAGRVESPSQTKAATLPLLSTSPTDLSRALARIQHGNQLRDRVLLDELLDVGAGGRKVRDRARGLLNRGGILCVLERPDDGADAATLGDHVAASARVECEGGQKAHGILLLGLARVRRLERSDEIVDRVAHDLGERLTNRLLDELIRGKSLGSGYVS